MIRWGTDLGAPALVAAADIATDELRPTWNRPLGIGLAVAGYLVHGLLGIGGDFTKNIGIAAMPWAIGSIYQYAKEAAGVTRRVPVSAGAQRLALRHSSPSGSSPGGVGRQYQREFEQAGAHAF